ncbi:Hypothetical protein NTJ_15811 [Nesidiocoris tenuis]|uniref:Tetraspanin n=1 Tax=Nesidiocoris tenuis TaxID=355587 RepID=A0ABN7BFA2_9HEMI|nr:Hypothetical protein NTJ_15811 [Nesidiocoris tenuis]
MSLIFSMSCAAIAALGAISVYKKLPKLQLAYAIIQIIIVAVLFILAMCYLICMTKSVKDMIKDLLEAKLTPQMKMYLQYKDAIDQLQQQLKCCGTTAYKYEDSKYPDSCCDIQPCTVAFPTACDTAGVELLAGTFSSALVMSLVPLPIKIALITLIMLIRQRLMTELSNENEN